MTDNDETWLDEVDWDQDGLVPVIAQDGTTGKVLNLAWMNREALALTRKENRAVYWSRSRQQIWRKGEQSGHVQELQDIRLDCDGDAILLTVNQTGGIACHTGRQRCFFKTLKNNTWETDEPVLKDPSDIYA